MDKREEILELALPLLYQIYDEGFGCGCKALVFAGRKFIVENNANVLIDKIEVIYE